MTHISRVLIPVFVLMLAASSLFAQTTGSIQGTVSDASKTPAEPISGAVITISSPQYGEQVTFSTEGGYYVFSNLNPGAYTVKAVFDKISSKPVATTVVVGQTFRVNLALAETIGAAETYIIESKAPNVNVASATVGISFSKEFINNVPMGRERNISDAFALSPTATTRGIGTGFGGGSVVENNYTIDGVNVTGLNYALLNTRLALDLVEQFDIKEGGTTAEEGRAMGGSVNLVTKSGGNEFHGSAWMIYRPGFLEGKRRTDPTDITGAIVSTRDINYYINAGFELGGPIVKDKLWFHIAYAPEVKEESTHRTFYWYTGKNAAGTGPLLVAPGQPQWTNDPLFEKFYSGLGQSHQYSAKLTYLVDKNQRHSIGFRGAPVFFSGYGDTTLSNTNFQDLNFVADPITFDLKREWNGNLVTAVYNYYGKFLDDKLKVDGGASFFYHKEKREARTPEGDAAFVTLGSIDLNRLILNPDDLPPICQGNTPETSFPGSPANPNTTFCQSTYGVGGAQAQGADTMPNSDTLRWQEQFSLTYLANFAGLHQLKWGVDLEQGLHYLNLRYSGNRNIMASGRPLSVSVHHNGIGQNEPVSFSTLALNYASYLTDSWNVTPSLIFNFGLRWEGQDFFAPTKTDLNSLERKLFFLENFAPRGSIVWDFTGKGQGALRLAYGRRYEQVPNQLVSYGMSGVGTLGIQSYSCPPPTTQDNQVLNEDQFNSKCVAAGPFVGGGANYIGAPGLLGQSLDEIVLSADYEAIPSWVFGVSASYTHLNDSVAQLTNSYRANAIFGNAGVISDRYFEDLLAQINTESDTQKRNDLIAAYKYGNFLSGLPKQRREILNLNFQVDKKLSDNFAFVGNYVLAWVYGNVEGQGAGNSANSNLGVTYATAASRLNIEGYQPSDIRHRFKLSGYYTAALKDFGVSNVPLAFTLGTSATLQSGAPLNMFSAYDPTLPIPSALLFPAGSMGRMPWNWNLDVSITASWTFSNDFMLEMFTALYNVANVQETLLVNQTYAPIYLGGVVGGDFNRDSPFIKNLYTGTAPVLPPSGYSPNINYGASLIRQNPFGAQFGVRAKF